MRSSNAIADNLVRDEAALPATQRQPESDQQWEVVLRGEVRARIRPIRKDDRALERHFIEALSPSSRRFRFLDTMKSPSPQLLTQLVDIDPSRDVALIALLVAEGDEQQIGVARLCGAPDGRRCEFAVTVADAWQRRGLGTHLMRRLSSGAVSRGFKSMYSVDASDNYAMRGFAAHLGMRRVVDPNDATQVIHSVNLKKFNGVES